MKTNDIANPIALPAKTSRHGPRGPVQRDDGGSFSRLVRSGEQPARTSGSLADRSNVAGHSAKTDPGKQPVNSDVRQPAITDHSASAVDVDDHGRRRHIPTPNAHDRTPAGIAEDRARADDGDKQFNPANDDTPPPDPTETAGAAPTQLPALPPVAPEAAPRQVVTQRTAATPVATEPVTTAPPAAATAVPAASGSSAKDADTSHSTVPAHAHTGSDPASSPEPRQSVGIANTARSDGVAGRDGQPRKSSGDDKAVSSQSVDTANTTRSDAVAGRDDQSRKSGGGDTAVSSQSLDTANTARGNATVDQPRKTAGVQTAEPRSNASHSAAPILSGGKSALAAPAVPAPPVDRAEKSPTSANAAAPATGKSGDPQGGATATVAHRQPLETRAETTSSDLSQPDTAPLAGPADTDAPLRGDAGTPPDSRRLAATNRDALPNVAVSPVTGDPPPLAPEQAAATPQPPPRTTADTGRFFASELTAAMARYATRQPAQETPPSVVADTSVVANADAGPSPKSDKPGRPHALVASVLWSQPSANARPAQANASSLPAEKMGARHDEQQIRPSEPAEEHTSHTETPTRIEPSPQIGTAAAAKTAVLPAQPPSPPLALASAIVAEPTWRPAPVAVATQSSALRAPLTPRVLEVRLNPDHLGALTATLSMSGSQLKVEINVTTHEAHERLKGEEQVIEKAIRSLGYDVSQVTVIQSSVVNNLPARADGSASAPLPQGREQLAGGTSQGDGGGRPGSQNGGRNEENGASAHGGKSPRDADRDRRSLYI